MKQILNIFLFIIIGTSSYAQTTIICVDSTNNKPIESVQVTFIKNGIQQTSVTDSKGKASTSWSTPLSAKLTHIEYNAKSITIDENNQTITFSPAITLLNPLVVTSQYAPQSAKNSVYKVKTISKQRIEKQGATNIQEVLKNELNISFSRDNATGSSGITLQGLSGQNVKVLLDGVPISGRSGVSNEIDMGQLNVNSIEQIEIIEGPMAVNYGADALAGVINIITNKDSGYEWSANLSLHEESVEKEYSAFDEGIHSPAATFTYKPSEKWYVQAEGRYNDFGGWIGDPEKYSDRDRQWYPKSQYNLGGLTRYNTDGFSIFYRLNYLNENIENLGKPSANQLYDPIATDEQYTTKRWSHQLQSEIKVGKLNMQPVISYTNYERTTRQYLKNLATDRETTTDDYEQDTIYFKTLFLRNTLSHLKWSWGSAQLGFDSNYERTAGTTLSDGEKSAFDISFFASTEIKAGEKLLIRPGIRYGYNSIYKTEPSPAINFKYQITTSSQVRLGYGRGFRAPSLRELYHEFIDSNHHIEGNKDLEPEYSHSFNADFTKSFPLQNMQVVLAGFYNNIKNRIGYISPETASGDMITTYRNISRYKTIGSTLTLQYHYKNLNISTGLAYTGLYQELQDAYAIPEFVYGTQLNGSFSYHWARPELFFSLYYKYNGTSKDYFEITKEDGSTAPELQKREGYHLLDLTIQKKLTEWASLSIGSKNLMNVTFVKNNRTTGGAHADTSGQTSVGYGRSYFLRMNFKLQSKQ
ncbi:TonB-dependent receptor plug domain-containing protein [Fulvivirga sediminis]|uniref:TonB-dependent receptor n=1 Tax=Fulvivirga sediminis TaxID=2803949 RepID=A0A937F3T0_9BACT|nr:TonB-dependent receptor [Fulvivirga sediminis]MBL3655817.1 TonB-dependent receptor [Fulvivirga sediminis]